MSSASTSRTIKFISKAGTYTAVIMCPDGDLYQEYVTDGSQITDIYPNFATTKPILYFVCTSSRVAEGVATPDGINFYFNGTLIEFSGDTSTGTFAGMFKKIAPSGTQLYYGLQFLKNIAAAAGYAPVTIKMVATISYGTQIDQIQAEYRIPVQQSTGNSYRVTITAGDTKNFVITEKTGNNSSVILTAKAYQSGAELSTGLSYQWEKMVNGGWQTLTGKTSQSLTVQEADIDTYGEFRVTVSLNGAEIGKDIQGVMDASDPFDIDPCPSPEDEAITEDPNGNGTVTYTPKVVKRGTNVKAIDTTFYFVVKDAAGVILNKWRDGDSSVNSSDPMENPNTAMTSYTVTRAQCMQAGGDVSVTITAKD